MTEADFFLRLEYRLCGEFEAVPPSEAPGLWCDGLIPTGWQLDADPLTISGVAWMGGLPGHHPVRYEEEWRFVLELHEQAGLDSMAWESLLPGQEVRDWVAVDLFARRLVITLPAKSGQPPG